MEQSGSELLRQAEEKQKKYDWAEAATIYGKLANSPHDSAKMAGHLIEALAYCLLKSGFQAETRSEFKRIVQRARESYEVAVRVYETDKIEDLAGRARARVLFTSFWLSDDLAEKRRLLEDAIPLAEQAAAGPNVQGDDDRRTNGRQGTVRTNTSD